MLPCGGVASCWKDKIQSTSHWSHQPSRTPAWSFVLTFSQQGCKSKTLLKFPKPLKIKRNSLCLMVIRPLLKQKLIHSLVGREALVIPKSQQMPQSGLVSRGTNRNPSHSCLQEVRITGWFSSWVGRSGNSTKWETRRNGSDMTFLSYPSLIFGPIVWTANLASWKYSP